MLLNIAVALLCFAGVFVGLACFALSVTFIFGSDETQRNVLLVLGQLDESDIVDEAD